MIVHLESIFARLRRLVSRSRWGVQLLRLPDADDAPPSERGLVMIQIDGLSRRQFEQALEEGRMPCLKRLIEREGHQVHSLYSGLPSSTPAVQGELFYGVRCATPAFQFVDHRTGKLGTMLDQDVAASVERRLAEQGEGLLEGGSSYSNIYTGGATESHFCSASMGWANFLQLNANPLRLAILAFINMVSFLRIAGLLLIECVLAVADCVRGIIARYDIVQEVRFIPARVAVCILLRELVEISVRMDLVRGLPIIHANLLGFDEQAHRRGPDSRFAHWALKGIDGAIARIACESRRSPGREYDVWVYSDHGQEHAVPFEELSGSTLEGTIAKALAPRDGGGSQGVSTTSKAQRRTAGRRHLLFRQVADPAPGRSPSGECGMMRVAAMGPVGFLYHDERLHEVELRALSRDLTGAGQVPMALFVDSNGEVIASVEGRDPIPLSGNAAHFLGEDHPFLVEVAEDLCELARHPDSGQIVLCGYKAGEPPVTFPMENGAHAGPGPKETHGFALLPPDAVLPARDGDYLRPIDLRHAALRFLGRKHVVEPFYIKGALRERDKRTLRVMTYNVHRCLGMDGLLSPARIARVIARYAPDIVALQELDAGRTRSRGEDQARIIADHLEMEFHFHPAVLLEGERYGDALLTHLPMELVRADILPTLSGEQGLEPRGALWARISSSGRVFNVFNTHLGLRREERRLQVNALLGPAWLGNPDCEDPIIFCGDLNLLPTSQTFRLLTNRLVDVQEALPGRAPQTFFSPCPPGPHRPCPRR